MSTVNESDDRIRLALVGAGVIGTMHGAVTSELGDPLGRLRGGAHPPDR